MMATELSEREEALWLQQPSLIALSDNLFVCIRCTNFSVSCLSGAARQSILYRYATGQVYPGKVNSGCGVFLVETQMLIDQAHLYNA